MEAVSNETAVTEAEEAEDKTWHEEYAKKMTHGQKITDGLARSMGSWAFIITQTIFVAIWMMLNTIAFAKGWDPYPFILLNLLFSTQAAYAAPIIMMSQNRSAERDRFQANADFQTNVESKKDIESVQVQLARIENEKLDRILTLLSDGDAGKLDAVLGLLKAAEGGTAQTSA